MTSARGKNKNSIAAVIAPCSSKKTVSADLHLQAKKLRRLSQSKVATNWLENLKSVRGALVEASKLYSGGGFSIARKTAAAFDADLYVISAGLGLVKGDRRIPAYDLSASTGPSDVRARIIGVFDEEHWWISVSSGRYSASLAKALANRESGLVLVALTRNYAPLVSTALAGLPAAERDRLRIFGVVEDLLHNNLKTQLMPYDARLDTLIPGPRASFAQRAMEHFATLLTNKPNFPTNVAGQRAAVQNQMLAAKRTEAISRPSITDAALRLEINRFIKNGLSRSAALRALRDVRKFACEENRFRRHYEAARVS